MDDWTKRRLQMLGGVGGARNAGSFTAFVFYSLCFIFVSSLDLKKKLNCCVARLK